MASKISKLQKLIDSEIFSLLSNNYDFREANVSLHLLMVKDIMGCANISSNSASICILEKVIEYKVTICYRVVFS